MRPGNLRSLAALLLLALAEAATGCGGAPKRTPAPAFRLQEEQARAGRKAWAKGDLPAAIAAQERALLAARSVEDEEGIALRVLDLAALHRAAGEPAAAQAALAELLAEPPPLPYPGRLRAEAARLAGLLALDAGEPAAGTRWAQRAVELCEAARCGRKGAMVNLQARAAFLAGDREEAVRLAREALSLNRDARDDAERANSLRVVADGQLALGSASAAAEAYADALALDKKLGLEDKIVLDLLGLGRAAQGQGHAEEARGWFERARAAAGAAGDESGAAEAEALLETLPQSR
jgi:tetratricopeptide (TPR) repeat protein